MYSARFWSSGYRICLAWHFMKRLEFSYIAVTCILLQKISTIASSLQNALAFHEMSDLSRYIRPIFICRVFTELFFRCSTPPLSVSGGRRLLSSRVAESGAGSSCRWPQVPIYILTGHQHLSDLGLSGPAGRRIPNYTPYSELCSPLHWTQRSSITLISFCGPLASAPVVPEFSRGVNENVVRIWKVSFILPPFFLLNDMH